MNKMLVEKDPDTVGIAHYLVENSCADTSEIVIDDDVSVGFLDDFLQLWLLMRRRLSQIGVFGAALAWKQP